MSDGPEWIIDKIYRWSVAGISILVGGLALSVIFDMPAIRGIIDEFGSTKVDVYRLLVYCSYAFIFTNLGFLTWHFFIKKLKTSPLSNAGYVLYLFVGDMLMSCVFYAQFFRPIYGGSN